LIYFLMIAKLFENLLEERGWLTGSKKNRLFMQVTHLLWTAMTMRNIAIGSSALLVASTVPIASITALKYSNPSANAAQRCKFKAYLRFRAYCRSFHVFLIATSLVAGLYRAHPLMGITALGAVTLLGLARSQGGKRAAKIATTLGAAAALGAVVFAVGQVSHAVWQVLQRRPLPAAVATLLVTGVQIGALTLWARYTL
jgi:hypothetical protein